MAPAKKAPNQKKLWSTPLARRELEGQLLDLAADPKTWRSEHLRRAYEIVAKHKPAETARQIVVDSVRAADLAIKTALRRDLALARGSALADFTANSKRIANCTKRLRKEIGTALDEAARSAFVGGPIDLESVQDFLCSCRKVVQRRPEDKVASAIYRDLVASKGDFTHGEDLPLEERMPKIAVDYEALPPAARLACEDALRMLVDEKLQHLTAHDIFASLHATSLPLISTEGLDDEPQIIDSYLTEIERIWNENGLDVGRGYNALRNDYLSPFHGFAERVLLDLRDPGSRIFSPFTDAEMKSAWAEYHKIPDTCPRDDISAAPFKGTRVITEHVLKSYLERSSKKSTSTSIRSSPANTGASPRNREADVGLWRREEIFHDPNGALPATAWGPLRPLHCRGRQSCRGGSQLHLRRNQGWPAPRPQGGPPLADLRGGSARLA